jgi:hypothetical protein
MWQALSLNRQMHMISTTLPLSETKTSFAFLIREKFDRKNMQYIKDRTEFALMTNFHVEKKNECKLQHIKQV